MNNKIIIAIIAVIVIAGGAFLLTRKADSPTSVESDNEGAMQAEAETSIQNSSIKDLIAKGQSQKCTFKSDLQNSNSMGTFYINGGKSSGDITVDAAGVKTVSHMIYDGTSSYVWMDGQNTGYKMSLNADASGSMQSEQVDTNKNYEFSCEKWKVDNSKFELPSGVTFQEMPAMPSADAGAAMGAGASANTKVLQQAACNNLPEPSKTTCLNAIK